MQRSCARIAAHGTPSAASKMHRARRASSARPRRLATRRSSSFRSGVVNVIADPPCDENSRFRCYVPLVRGQARHRATTRAGPAASEAVPSLRLQSLAEFFSDTESLTWLVDGVLSEGGLSLLAGKPKAGKSTLA